MATATVCQRRTGHDIWAATPSGRHRHLGGPEGPALSGPMGAVHRAYAPAMQNEHPTTKPVGPSLPDYRYQWGSPAAVTGCSYRRAIGGGLLWVSGAQLMTLSIDTRCLRGTAGYRDRRWSQPP